MDEMTSPEFAQRSSPAPVTNGWADLREWLTLVDQQGLLHRIVAEVDPSEELSAITFMASRDRKSPALLFETFGNNPLGARVLSNMLGASKERYALAMGLDPKLSIAALVQATREITKKRIAPVWIPVRKRRSTRSSCVALRLI